MTIISVNLASGEKTFFFGLHSGDIKEKFYLSVGVQFAASGLGYNEGSDKREQHFGVKVNLRMKP